MLLKLPGSLSLSYFILFSKSIHLQFSSHTTKNVFFVKFLSSRSVRLLLFFFSHCQECLLCPNFYYLGPFTFIFLLTLPGMSSLSTFLPSRSSHLHFFFSHCQGCLLCLNFCLPGPFSFISPLQILSLLSN